MQYFWSSFDKWLFKRKTSVNPEHDRDFWYLVFTKWLEKYIYWKYTEYRHLIKSLTYRKGVGGSANTDRCSQASEWWICHCCSNTTIQKIERLKISTVDVYMYMKWSCKLCDKTFYFLTMEVIFKNNHNGILKTTFFQRKLCKLC